MLKFSDERRIDDFKSQETYAGRSSEVGGRVSSQWDPANRFLPRQTLESQHSGTPSAKVEETRAYPPEADKVENLEGTSKLPQKARGLETPAGSESTARTEKKEAPRNLGDPLRS